MPLVRLMDDIRRARGGELPEPIGTLPIAGARPVDRSDGGVAEPAAALARRSPTTGDGASNCAGLETLTSLSCGPRSVSGCQAWGDRGIRTLAGHRTPSALALRRAFGPSGDADKNPFAPTVKVASFVRSPRTGLGAFASMSPCVAKAFLPDA